MGNQPVLLKAILFFGSCVSLVVACRVIRPYEVYEYDKIPTTKNMNACKLLQDTCVVYAIFVDVDIYHPWTEFDIASTMDSLKKAGNWISDQSVLHQRNVHFEIVQHKQNAKLTIYEDKAKASLSLNGLNATSAKARKKLYPWANAIARYAGKAAEYKASSKIQQPLKIQDVNSLILALRDKYERENVALLFFVNGFTYNDPSYSFYTSINGDPTEYSIITTKNPAVVAHELLHLFGAVDLYPNYNFPHFNFKELEEKYPDEIMRVQHKTIEKLSISPITAYFVGWADTLNKPDTRLLLHKTDLIAY